MIHNGIIDRLIGDNTFVDTLAERVIAKAKSPSGECGCGGHGKTPVTSQPKGMTMNEVAFNGIGLPGDVMFDDASNPLKEKAVSVPVNNKVKTAHGETPLGLPSLFD